MAASPIVGMLTGKQKAGGVTYGLAEVDYDVRIKQGLHFTRDKYGKPITLVPSVEERSRKTGYPADFFRSLFTQHSAWLDKEYP